MIVVGYNGFPRAAERFASLYGRTGIDRNRLLGHDAAASVFVDGKLVAAVEEERLSRAKRTSAMPVGALRFCLEQAGITAADVDLFAFAWCFDDEVMRRLVRETIDRPTSIGDTFDQLGRLATLHQDVIAPETVRRDLEATLGEEVGPERLLLVPHHTAHLMCGYYLSGGGDTAFLISDGRAECCSSIAGHVTNRTITMFEDMEVGIGDSLAQLYSKVTRYLGFVPNNDEYKVMGLAAFGPKRPLTPNPLFEAGVVQLREHGRYTVDVDNVLHDKQTYYALFDELFGFSAPPVEFDAMARVAASVQDVVERVTAHQLDELRARTDHSRVLLEGGLALNCVNNTRLADRGAFSDVRVSFGASDPGVAIGAGFLPFFQEGTEPVAAGSPYLGPEFCDEDIAAQLRSRSDALTWTEYDEDDLLSVVVELLRGPAVVGWFQGRTEYGPRALGNRSILANPRFPQIQDIVNSRVKKRELFRPFAPVILEDRASEVFDLGDRTGSPYMTMAFSVRPAFSDAIPGALHVDGTSRIQTVSSQQNPRLASLLKRLGEEDGLPCLINTSFNVAGEPIVSSPGDAVQCFMGTEIDALVLGNTLVRKR